MNTDLINLDDLYSEEVAPITVDVIKKVYPTRISDTVAQRCADMMNESIKDLNSVEKIHFKENLIGYIDAIKGTEDNKRGYNLTEYINAVKFVTYKMMGNTDLRAYALTFPDRVQRLATEKVPHHFLNVYANKYAKNKIVVDLYAKILVPVHIMYQDYFALAVKTQVELMTDNNVSPKVRSDAANSLMTHLKQPEVKKAEIAINTKDSGVIGALADALNNLSEGQVELIKRGEASLDTVREATIIEVREEDYETV